MWELIAEAFDWIFGSASGTAHASTELDDDDEEDDEEEEEL